MTGHVSLMFNEILAHSWVLGVDPCPRRLELVASLSKDGHQLVDGLRSQLRLAGQRWRGGGFGGATVKMDAGSSWEQSRTGFSMFDGPFSEMFDESNSAHKQIKSVPQPAAHAGRTWGNDDSGPEWVLPKTNCPESQNEAWWAWSKLVGLLQRFL